MQQVTIAGAGLAGSEAAWQLALRGIPVHLIDMKPARVLPPFEQPLFAELLCSNSFRNSSLTSAIGLLKEELRLGGSLVMEAADLNTVPAGKALAVDRQGFSETITNRLKSSPLVTISSAELEELPKTRPLIIATGPLTSPRLADALFNRLGGGLYFYDAIAPIISADSIDLNAGFFASRWEEGDDYFNLPLTKDQYYNLVRELNSARCVETRNFEKAIHFEGCLPVEELARRGEQTLAFGPLKPVGLRPPSGLPPFAVLQLRKENKSGTAFNLVGFQTRMLQSEQERILRSLPGLSQARFERFGSMHRNTYIDAPRHLHPTGEWKTEPGVFFAGQITGVEGYVESAASGFITAVILAKNLHSSPAVELPQPTFALAALMWHLTRVQPAYTPSNINWSLFAPLTKKVRDVKLRKKLLADRALEDLKSWFKANSLVT